MNRLSLARRTQIIRALVEGNSIRSTERMTNSHRDTVKRLMVEVGTGCQKLHNERIQNLPCKRMPFVALVQDTKPVPSCLTGKRT